MVQCEQKFWYRNIRENEWRIRMKQLMLKPTIYKYDTCKEFADEFHIEKGDLVITNEYIYEPFFGKMDLECDVIFQEKYGAGEPSDDMAEAIYKDIKGEHKRIIAIGGGTVIDISKLFALVSPIKPLYHLLIHNMEFCNLLIPKSPHILLLILTYVLSFDYMWSGLTPYKSRVLSIFHHKNGPV